MRSAAVIVGIDDYATQPLTSGVNDAMAFRRALLDLGLVDESSIYLLTSPVGGGAAAQATKKNITDLMYDFYDEKLVYDRLVFFFAGHGLLAFCDPARSRVRNTLVPVDVKDLNRDGSLLLDLDELKERLRFNGPAEQLYIIDACRDLNYKLYPDVGNLGWAGGRPLGAVRSQACLYAVSPLGQAEGVKGGLGRMTTHVLDALRSETAAVQYDDLEWRWVVSMRSVAEYVKGRIEDAMIGEPLYKKRYMLPQLDDPDPQPRAIRVIDRVPPTPLTVHITPDEAARGTNVTISLKGQALEGYGLPPRRNHETMDDLLPQRYLLEARSSLGVVRPDRAVIDLRTTSEASLVVGISGDEVTAARRDVASPATPSYGERPVTGSIAGNKAGDVWSVEEEGVSRGLGPETPQADTGVVQASALEPEVAVELRSLDPPPREWSGYQELRAEVPAGPYEVRFRLGQEVFSRAEVYVKPGESVVVKPSVSDSPILREALEWGGSSAPDSTVVSESLGAIQAGVLETILPLIGIKAFDQSNEFLRRFQGLLEPVDPAALGLRSLSVVVAVDGDGWGEGASGVLAGIRVSLPAGTAADVPTANHGDPGRAGMMQLRPLAASTLNRLAPGREGFGLERIGVAILPVSSSSFFIEFESPHLGHFSLASASLPKRATVVTIMLRPDGTLDIGQNLLRYPGTSATYADELVSDISYARMVRELQMGQQLYKSGELFRQTTERGSGRFTGLFYAKWTDPVLSCMACRAWLKALGDKPAPLTVANGPPIVRETTNNLMRYFGDLPDSRVLHGLLHQDERKADFTSLIDRRQTPILAENARELARYGEERRLDVAWLTELARKAPFDQVWSVYWM
jgi:hypothetical protein